MASFERVREALDIDKPHEAIRLACKSRHLGNLREPITKARQAIDTPEFYRDLGQDPKQIVAAGIAAVRLLCKESA